MGWLDTIPLPALAIGALLLGLAPFIPEPHLLEKTRMLFSGTLTRPLDIFDFAFHAALPILLIVRLVRIFLAGNS